MKNIAIIPARSGSKGIKDKNIRYLCGKPLMAYTIEAAISSGEFDEIMVSTDSEEYADVARKFGAKVPFLRSSDNSTDEASSWDLVDEVLDRYGRLGYEYDTFCLLQPTSPLRTEEDIREAYNLFRTRADYAVVSVCEAEHSPLWCGHLPPDFEFRDFIGGEFSERRQSGDRFYRLNGAIYIVNIKRFRSDKFLYREGSYAYIMPQLRSIDIDTEIDIKLAEILIDSKNKIMN